ncbi:metallophosphoesterase [Bacillus marinisedimentorum]|uniref:metallophosphoesterase n=1 Tax=Bacillus marinisedimentorum TaxID=1821260 RepID=UPI0007DFF561|nr:metallophosphoesterase [Bacillus marinisedimentorum]
MGKLVIVSDSHGNRSLISDIAARHKGDASLMVHCGDSELDAAENELHPFLTVRGNCDLDASLPEEQTGKWEGQNVYVTHGHLHNVKMSLMPLSYRAEELDAQIVCFGHSHIAGAEMHNGMLFINPGSILLPRRRPEQTYALVSAADKGQICVSFHREDGMELEGMTRTFTLGRS